jgi:predicted TIM-barrel fold metal-dependent hydrolase
MPGADPNPRTPSVKFPPGATDCHAHVFGPQTRFPYPQNPNYVPPDATTDDYVRMLRAIGCERAVLVQPSVYRTDNRCMLDAMRSGKFSFRGVAVIGEETTDAELKDMHAAGVRGVRLNLASKGTGTSVDAAMKVAQRIAPLGWHVQFFLNIGAVPEIEQLVPRLPVDVVIDHFALAPADQGVAGAGFQALLRMAKHPRCWFKLIGPYRISQDVPKFANVAPLARALFAAAPDRCVWGTDWPHPNTAHIPNDGDLATILGDWLPEAGDRKRVLMDNPARLYDF